MSSDDFGRMQDPARFWRAATLGNAWLWLLTRYVFRHASHEGQVVAARGWRLLERAKELSLPATGHELWPRKGMVPPIIAPQNILKTRKYDFINLSLGPELPIDDSEVHAWTAVLDDFLRDGKCLAVVAVGNGGERDVALFTNRVQVPADCVNALAVGAAGDFASQCVTTR